MTLRLLKQLPLLLVLTLAWLPATAQDDQIYGRQLMTEQERAEYREQMRNLRTQEEREQFRREHHRKMQERAKARGMTLPDEPPQRGKGMNQGKGKGQGMGGGRGSGQGMGQDKKQGRGY